AYKSHPQRLLYDPDIATLGTSPGSLDARISDLRAGSLWSGSGHVLWRAGCFRLQPALQFPTLGRRQIGENVFNIELGQHLFLADLLDGLTQTDGFHRGPYVHPKLLAFASRHCFYLLPNLGVQGREYTAISLEPALIFGHEAPDLLLLFARLNAEHVQGKAVLVHRQVARAHQQAWIIKHRSPPHSGAARFHATQASLSALAETPPQLIGNIPEGDFALLHKPLSVPDALGVQATVNAQAQFDQERQVALAGHDRRPLEFENVPGRQCSPHAAEGGHPRPGAAQQRNVRFAWQVTDRYAV